MEESKIPCSSESSGQNMLKNQPEELRAWKRSCEHIFALTILVSKCHLTIFASDDIFFLNDSFVEIATEIDQCFFAIADKFAIGNPYCRIVIRKRKSHFFHSVEHFCSKYFSKRFAIEKVSLLSFSFFETPKLFFLIDCPDWHHQIDMRVLIERA